MRIGIELVPDLAYWQSTILGILAERAGFDTIWVTDHFPNRDPYAILSMLSEYTSTVKLGPSVQSPLTRHPASIATSIATIDELSDGRAILGLGPGDKTMLGYLDQSWKGIIHSLKTTIGVIRELWKGEKVSLQDRNFSLQSASIRVYPRHQIPIYLAAAGPMMLNLAGELADGVLMSGAPFNEFRDMLKHLDQGIHNRTLNADIQKVALALVSVDPDYEAAITRTKRVVAVVSAGSSTSLLRKLNISLEQIAQIRNELKQGNFLEAENLVTEKMIQSFTIAGTTEDIINRINQLKSLNFDELVIGSPLGPNKSEAIRIFKTDIIPSITNSRS